MSLFTILIKDITKNPQFPWKWDYISGNPNLTMEFIKENPYKPWQWDGISQNPNITIKNINKIYYEILKEQIDSLSNSKLLEVSTLNVGVLFDKQIDSEKEKLMELLSKVPSLNLMFIDENVSFGESKTLIKLKN